MNEKIFVLSVSDDKCDLSKTDVEQLFSNTVRVDKEIISGEGKFAAMRSFLSSYENTAYDSDQRVFSLKDNKECSFIENNIEVNISVREAIMHLIARYDHFKKNIERFDFYAFVEKEEQLLEMITGAQSLTKFIVFSNGSKQTFNSVTEFCRMIVSKYKNDISAYCVKCFEYHTEDTQ